MNLYPLDPAYPHFVTFSLLTALCPRKAVPPSGLAALVYRAYPQRRGSLFNFRLHLSFGELGVDDFARLHLGG